MKKNLAHRPQGLSGTADAPENFRAPDADAQETSPAVRGTEPADDVLTVSLSAADVSLAAPDAPEQILVGAAGAQSWDPETRTAVLTWEPIRGAAKYSVKYSRDGGYTWFATMKTPELRQTLFNAKPGNVYKLKVVGYDAEGRQLRSHNVGTFVAEGVVVSGR